VITCFSLHKPHLTWLKCNRQHGKELWLKLVHHHRLSCAQGLFLLNQTLVAVKQDNLDILEKMTSTPMRFCRILLKIWFSLTPKVSRNSKHHISREILLFLFALKCLSWVFF